MTATRWLAAAALVAFSCGRAPETKSAAGDGQPTQPGDSAASPTSADAPRLGENDVQAVLDAVNAVDVRLAAAGSTKLRDPEAARFASRLGSAHPQKVTDRPPPVAGAAGDAVLAPLRARQAALVAALDSLGAGPQFDRAFLDAQVELHALALDALAPLDRATAARPDAGPGDLPDQVARARADVSRHLDEARALQSRRP